MATCRAAKTPLTYSARTINTKNRISEGGNIRFKRALLAASRNRLVLVTNEKFATRAAHRVADLKDIETFVVEHNAPPDALDELAAAGCALMTADRPL